MISCDKLVSISALSQKVETLSKYFAFVFTLEGIINVAEIEGNQGLKQTQELKSITLGKALEILRRPESNKSSGPNSLH